mmetsp:Transcript_15256/g.34807  ORF Transcript_15256/g.34807 Transcript_15256/m.34807 type:complete len:210 (-) Transcript_15256:743-1372(-)
MRFTSIGSTMTPVSLLLFRNSILGTMLPFTGAVLPVSPDPPPSVGSFSLSKAAEAWAATCLACKSSSCSRPFSTSHFLRSSCAWDSASCARASNFVGDIVPSPKPCTALLSFSAPFRPSAGTSGAVKVPMTLSKLLLAPFPSQEAPCPTASSTSAAAFSSRVMFASAARKKASLACFADSRAASTRALADSWSSPAGCSAGALQTASGD